jgi:hypothetical protein
VHDQLDNVRPTVVARDIEVELAAPYAVQIKVCGQDGRAPSVQGTD